MGAEWSCEWGKKTVTGILDNRNLIQSLLDYFQKQPYMKHLEIRGNRTIPESTV